MTVGLTNLEALKSEISNMRKYVNDNKDSFINMNHFAETFRDLLQDNYSTLNDIFYIAEIIGLDNHNKVATSVEDSRGEGRKDIGAWVEENNIIFSRYNSKTKMVDRIVVSRACDNYEVGYIIREDADAPDAFIGTSGNMFIVYQDMCSGLFEGRFSISYMDKWNLLSTSEKRTVQSLAQNFLCDIESSVYDLLSKFQTKIENRFEKLED